ncbi:hypothetical protein KI387_029562, partial [Taxus chinensis]
YEVESRSTSIMYSNGRNDMLADSSFIRLIDIRGVVWIHYPYTLTEAIEKAYIVEETR